MQFILIITETMGGGASSTQNRNTNQSPAGDIEDDDMICGIDPQSIEPTPKMDAYAKPSDINPFLTDEEVKEGHDRQRSNSSKQVLKSEINETKSLAEMIFC